MTVAEAAAALRVSRSSVYEMIHRGELPSIRIGTTIRIPRRAVDELLAGRHSITGPGGPRTTTGPAPADAVVDGLVAAVAAGELVRSHELVAAAGGPTGLAAALIDRLDAGDHHAARTLAQLLGRWVQAMDTVGTVLTGALRCTGHLPAHEAAA